MTDRTCLDCNQPIDGEPTMFDVDELCPDCTTTAITLCGTTTARIHLLKETP